MYQLAWMTTASVALLLLGGCAAEPSSPGSSPAPETATESPAETPSEKPETEQAITGPREQVEDCGWNDPVLTPASLPEIPTGQKGQVEEVIVGAWQHTHFDSGAGYVPVENDIRYVFPSSERLLFCQDVPGVTDQAQSTAAVSWEGTTMVLPGVAPGYIVTEWNDSTMVWINRMDESRFLLQRR